MAKLPVRSVGQVPDEWAKHIETIRRLYLDEDMTLQEVMRIMASEYGFVASAKMYKKRLRDCNLRKNIRSTQSDAQAYQHIFTSRDRPAQVRLSNGQVVATHLLTTHMQRKMNRVRAPAMVRAPDRYYHMESAYVHCRSYLLGLSGQTVTSAADHVLVTVPEMDQYTQKWSNFVQTLGDALDMFETIRLGEAVVVMRKAPQEFSTVLEHRSANIIGCLFMFLVVATPRRPGITDNELQVFLSIVKSLLNFGSTVLPTGHPLRELLRSLARWDTEDLENFARNNSASCQTIGQFFPLGSLGYNILFKEVEAAQWIGFTAPSTQPSTRPSTRWDRIRIKKYDEWLAQQTLFNFPG